MHEVQLPSSWGLVVWLCTVTLACLAAATIHLLWMRARGAKVDPLDPVSPASANRSSLALELGWMAIPALMLTWILWMGWMGPMGSEGWNGGRMPAIPSLPSGGHLRLLAISGSVALLAFLASALALLLASKRRAAVWAAAALGMSLTSFGLGRFAPALHPFASAATLVLAARNIQQFDATPRALEAIGLLAWVVAILAARALFGR